MPLLYCIRSDFILTEDSPTSHPKDLNIVLALIPCFFATKRMRNQAPSHSHPCPSNIQDDNIYGLIS